MNSRTPTADFWHSLTEGSGLDRAERLAAVGWVQSQVRDAAQREILFELDTLRRGVFDREGKSETFDTLSKNVANLMRMWAEL